MADLTPEERAASRAQQVEEERARFADFKQREEGLGYTLVFDNDPTLNIDGTDYSVWNLAGAMNVDQEKLHAALVSLHPFAFVRIAEFPNGPTHGVLLLDLDDVRAEMRRLDG